eukprot:NODE_3716_length_1301_cov_22.444822_g3250_i0.p1 GENE.NODE_3716_length_1301_cov_22.444822_g3250_i0~~NODE_3716_length_1301_cov_22.444822_g3250_i0.p1  ORF type:complete len:361 (+),score=32.25 NODE_3716_length_1301_cov_22.444822_g3250_i0:44-1084(+)
MSTTHKFIYSSSYGLPPLPTPLPQYTTIIPSLQTSSSFIPPTSTPIPHLQGHTQTNIQVVIPSHQSVINHPNYTYPPTSISPLNMSQGTSFVCQECKTNQSNPGYTLCENCYRKKPRCDLCNTKAANSGFTKCYPCFKKYRTWKCESCRVQLNSENYKLCQLCYTKRKTQHIVLAPTEAKYIDISKQLSEFGVHVQSIIALRVNDQLQAQYDQYRDSVQKYMVLNNLKSYNKGGPGNEQRRFHGTSYNCTFGINGNLTPCAGISNNCRTCAIINDGFKLNYIGQTTGNLGYFGKGHYFSSKTGTSLAYCRPNPQGARALSFLFIMSSSGGSTLYDKLVDDGPGHSC